MEISSTFGTTTCDWVIIWSCPSTCSWEMKDQIILLEKDQQIWWNTMIYWQMTLLSPPSTAIDLRPQSTCYVTHSRMHFWCLLKHLWTVRLTTAQSVQNNWKMSSTNLIVIAEQIIISEVGIWWGVLLVWWIPTTPSRGWMKLSAHTKMEIEIRNLEKKIFIGAKVWWEYPIFNNSSMHSFHCSSCITSWESNRNIGLSFVIVCSYDFEHSM